MACGNWSALAGKQYAIAIAALIASTAVWLIVSLCAFVLRGLLLGLATAALGIYALRRIGPGLKLLRNAPPRPISAAAFHLLIVPVALIVSQMALVPRAIVFSRSRAIRNSAPLIADIERYRAANGRYPASLLSVGEDYLPGVIGIRGYHYEPSEDAYNLVFEQLALNFGTREFVVYNPATSRPSSATRWIACR